MLTAGLAPSLDFFSVFGCNVDPTYIVAFYTVFFSVMDIRPELIDLTPVFRELGAAPCMTDFLALGLSSWLRLGEEVPDVGCTFKVEARLAFVVLNPPAGSVCLICDILLRDAWLSMSEFLPSKRSTWAIER